MTFVCAPAGHHLAFIIKHLGLWLHLHNTLYTHSVAKTRATAIAIDLHKSNLVSLSLLLYKYIEIGCAHNKNNN